MNFEQARDVFFNRFNADGKGPKLALFVTGGGFSILDFMTKPGASRILDRAVMPYSSEALINFLGLLAPWASGFGNLDPATFKSCNAEMAAQYAGTLYRQYMIFQPKGATLPVILAITAALTTHKFRKGENRAFIAHRSISGQISVTKISLKKMDEETHSKIATFPDLLEKVRKDEDRTIAQVAFAILTGDKDLLPSLKEGESIELMDKKATTLST